MKQGLGSTQMSECFYCGVINGNCRDHVVPHSYYSNSRYRKYETGQMVPACNQCNITLSNHLFPTLQARAAYLLAKYKNKNRRLLAIPDWSDEQLELCEGNLRRSIEQSLAAKDALEKRLRHLELVAYDSGIEDD